MNVKVTEDLKLR